ncbi:MAG: MFS transporter [Chloroflexi bacterium]|nr:MFS transporter [Chloroflexota bacterium]
MTDIAAPATEKGLPSKWLVLGVVMLGTIMGPLDGSIVNTVLPTITQSFHTDISIVQWVPTVYLLTISCLILLYGRLGDMLGYKKVFVYGLAGFTVASVLCALSHNIWMLISFRAVQGLAAAMTMAVSFAIITAAFPPVERGKALGLSAVSIAVGLAAGPSLGGVITEHTSWRYIFLINFPIGVVSLILAIRFIPESVKKAGQHLDLRGALAAFICLLSLLLYADRGEPWGWLSPGCISLLIVGVLSGAWFLRIQQTSVQPMLNLSLFSNRVFSFASLSALFSFMAAYALVFLTPFLLTFALHYNIGKVGWVMASAPIATLLVAPLSGAASDRIGTRGLTFCGMILCSLGLVFMSNLKASASASDVMWRLAVFGAGSGMFQSPNNSAVMGNVPRAHLGVASGVLAAARNVGMALGIAVAGAVLYNVAPIATSGQPGSFTPSEIEEFLTGLHWAYIAGAALAGIAALTSLGAVARRKQD